MLESISLGAELAVAVFAMEPAGYGPKVLDGVGEVGCRQPAPDFEPREGVVPARLDPPNLVVLRPQHLSRLLGVRTDEEVKEEAIHGRSGLRSEVPDLACSAR